MKKILILGAMQMHLPLIKRAKERGLYVHTCDYVIENEGHKYADEPHYDSTTDFEAVLKIATKAQIDAVFTFNSDPAALTAAYVTKVLNLPGGGYEAVKVMSEKDLFRQFLLNNGFNVPKFSNYTDWKSLEKDISKFKFPILLKPVDSSGSKGVVIINNPEHLRESFENALQFSRCKRIIIEEFIESVGAQFHGDGFVYNNKFVFVYLGDHHFNAAINNLVPYSTTFPSQHSQEDIERVKKEVERFISLVGFKQGGINIEARISAADGNVYLIEVGPRNGGNFTPIVIQYAAGFNFVDAMIDSALGVFKTGEQEINPNGYFAYLILHSSKEGMLKNISINPELEKKVIEKYIYVKKGERVHSFKGANAAIGVLIVKFDSFGDMNNYIDNFADYYKIELE
ncbi:ATP-grasp domain-containing protein [Bacteroidales bacterium OttesenSCG-928-K22]|nr:ATP-grasp domain-containing protein [Bacteroidales bacterium OttesenSCG-928-L14]MDL2240960.1 ATP-grasp domain-containing protein [Bacteroidales bacterium OttesenSCG-928-K22]